MGKIKVRLTQAEVRILLNAICTAEHVPYAKTRPSVKSLRKLELRLSGGIRKPGLTVEMNSTEASGMIAVMDHIVKSLARHVHTYMGVWPEEVVALKKKIKAA